MLALSLGSGGSLLWYHCWDWKGPPRHFCGLATLLLILQISRITSCTALYTSDKFNLTPLYTELFYTGNVIPPTTVKEGPMNKKKKKRKQRNCQTLMKRYKVWKILPGYVEYHCKFHVKVDCWQNCCINLLCDWSASTAALTVPTISSWLNLQKTTGDSGTWYMYTVALVPYKI